MTGRPLAALDPPGKGCPVELSIRKDTVWALRRGYLTTGQVVSVTEELTLFCFNFFWLPGLWDLSSPTVN